MNIPNLDFPELNLKLSYLRNEKKPNKKFERHAIKLVRITSVRQSLSFIVYPEFKYAGEWYKFWHNDKPIVAKMIVHSINGIMSGSNRFRLNKIKKTIEKWLKKFTKFKIVTTKIKEKPDEDDEDEDIVVNEKVKIPPIPILDEEEEPISTDDKNMV